MAELQDKENPVSMDVQFTPYDHTTVEVPKDESLAAFGSQVVKPFPKEVGYLEGTLANLAEHDITWQLAHGAWMQSEDYLDGYKDPNFNPLDHKEKFVNVDLKYQPFLLSAENAEQMDSRLKWIYHEQWLDETVKNSSWMQWLSGTALSFPLDLLTYIPIINQVKYANLGKTAIRSAMRAAPGGLAYGMSSAAGEQLNKIDGNMKDFLIDGAIRSTFATSLFAAAPLASLAADKLALWDLQSYVADAVNGVGYKLAVNQKGAVTGIKAYDMTGNEAMNAAKVKLAQDKADSAFSKTGLFKIPYIGKAAEKFLSNSAFGSNTLDMLNSVYPTVRMVMDLAYDHGIVTKGLEEGKPRPMTFFTRLMQTQAHIRQEQNIFNALHMERNGIDSKNYLAQNLYRGGLYARQKSLEMIGSQIGNKAYINPTEFMQEIQQVMRTGVAHSENSVNEAAAMFKKSMDEYYKAFRIAHNLPEDWLPPRTSEQYLMRVYDTNYLNNNLEGPSGWLSVISNELRNQDNTILKYTQPIRDVEAKIEQNIAKQQEYLSQPNIADAKKEYLARELQALKAQKKALEESLQDEIRNNPDLHILADDWNALSAKEANELTALTKRRDIAANEVSEQKKKIAAVKDESKRRSQAALKNKDMKSAKANVRKAETGLLSIEKEEEHLVKLEAELEKEEAELQAMAHSGKINPRFIYKEHDSAIYKFKNPNERLRLRKTYHEQPGYRVSEAEAHEARIEHAKAYYQTIMNQTAEDTINQIMGKFTGNGLENHTKQRTLMIPDEVLYKYNFMTKDLLSKVANYKMWLARRTHLKNTYANSSIDGGFEPIIKQLQSEFDLRHSGLSSDKAAIQQKLENKQLLAEEKKKLEKALSKIEKELQNETKRFGKAKEQVQHVYEKMMGISRLNKKAKKIVSSIKSMNVAANLGFLPISMLTDLTANGLKQGLIPFIQSGLYPTIQSIGGLLKTHDSVSFREICGALNLALHHVGGTSASRQMDLATNPYLNLGRIPQALDKMAHFSQNINLASTIDNYLQQVTASVAQSNVIAKMMAFEKGTLSKADRMWLNRYGLDPEKDAAKILAAFRKDGGGSNKLGGYQSNFWHWKDIETANKVSDAVYRSTQDTIISANGLDHPMWLDENQVLNIMAPIIRGFKGWAFASLNRYLIPTLQTPDAQKLMGFALMTASAALVSPTRRMARGQDPYKEGTTSGQIAAEILLDSPQFAWLSEAYGDFNLLTQGSLLGDLKNDKYRDRTLAGLLGPTGSNVNKLWNFANAMAAGDMNEHDVRGMASMIPVINTVYGYQVSQSIIEGFGLPKYRNKQ